MNRTNRSEYVANLALAPMVPNEPAHLVRARRNLASARQALENRRTGRRAARIVAAMTIAAGLIAGAGIGNLVRLVLA